MARMHCPSIFMVMFASVACSSALVLTKNNTHYIRTRPKMLVPPPTNLVTRTEDRKCNTSGDPLFKSHYDWCTAHGKIVELTAHDGETLKMWVFNTTGADTVLAYLGPSFTFIYQACELAVDMVTKRGISVVLMNWRGWGLTPRYGDAQRGQGVVHFDSYEDIFLDLDLMLAKAYEGHKRLSFMSQSAGSVVAARYIQAHWKGSTPINKAMFVVPSFRMKFTMPDWIGLVLAKAAGAVLGEASIASIADQKFYTDDEYIKDVFGAGCLEGTHNSPRCGGLTEWIRCYPEAITGGVSYGWIAKQIWQGWSAIWDASKITMPVMLIQAGNDTTVDNMAQDSFCTGVPDCKMIRTTARHWALSESDEFRNQGMDPLIKFV